MNDSTWTWMAGGMAPFDNGVYGENGNASTDYVPSGRKYGVAWCDSSMQEFWLFGGRLNLTGEYQ